ncbi:MAG: NMT1/THI5 like protein [Syntrophorhabdaceae bacterium PtaU1.Bin034]|nr:MAG: NMT1/THI5 like protein [Syntrophorhabdaceae bacterium PtaU1.Bin034]
MMKGKSFLIGLALVALSAFSAHAYDLRWGTAPVGGLWGVLGNAMIEDVLKANPNIKGSTVPIGGAANILGIAENKLNIAFSFSDVAYDAWEGNEFFKAKGKIRNIRALACLFPEPTQFAVYADSGITSIAQLKGKKVTPGPKGSAIELVTRRILQEYGLSYKDMKIQLIGFEDGAQLMIDNHLDAVLYGAMVYPAPTLMNINSQRQIRLLSLSDEVMANLVKKYKGLIPYTLPAQSYKGITSPTKGVASMVNLVVDQAMPDDVAYAITKIIAQNFERYKGLVKPMALAKLKEMPNDAGIPFHPGALKYYKERGWIK